MLSWAYESLPMEQGWFWRLSEESSKRPLIPTSIVQKFVPFAKQSHCWIFNHNPNPGSNQIPLETQRFFLLIPRCKISPMEVEEVSSTGDEGNRTLCKVKQSFLQLAVSICTYSIIYPNNKYILRDLNLSINLFYSFKQWNLKP